MAGEAPDQFDRFLQTFWMDLDQGRVRPVAWYVDQFPDHARAIRDEYQRTIEARSDVTPGSGTTQRMVARPRPGSLPVPDGLELDRLIGRGGMGRVFRAWQTKLDRWVAVKFLNEPDSDPTFVARFRREAAMLAKLSHPNIIAVHDFFDSGRSCGIVMEHFEGHDLRAVLDRGLPDARTATAIVTQVIAAIAHAHERGVVHRDIKPANILIGADGGVKVADFGLARLFHSRDSALELTATGDILGTPGWMAPEQLSDPASVGPQADVYAMGILLETLSDALIAGGGGQPPIAEARLDAVVARATARRPSDRFPDVRALESALWAEAAEPQHLAPSSITAAPPPSEGPGATQPGDQASRLPLSALQRSGLTMAGVVLAAGVVATPAVVAMALRDGFMGRHTRLVFVVATAVYAGVAAAIAPGLRNWPRRRRAALATAFGWLALNASVRLGFSLKIGGTVTATAAAAAALLVLIGSISIGVPYFSWQALVAWHRAASEDPRPGHRVPPAIRRRLLSYSLITGLAWAVPATITWYLFGDLTRGLAEGATPDPLSHAMLHATLTGATGIGLCTLSGASGDRLASALATAIVALVFAALGTLIVAIRVANSTATGPSPSTLVIGLGLATLGTISFFRLGCFALLPPEPDSPTES